MLRPDERAAAGSPKEGKYWQSVCSQPGRSSGQVWPNVELALAGQVHTAPDMLRSGLTFCLAMSIPAGTQVACETTAHKF